jgi:hypothetical protein
VDRFRAIKKRNVKAKEGGIPNTQSEALAPVSKGFASIGWHRIILVDPPNLLNTPMQLICDEIRDHRGLTKRNDGQPVGVEVWALHVSHRLHGRHLNFLQFGDSQCCHSGT